MKPFSNRPLHRAILGWALVAVAIDAALLAGLFAIDHLTKSSGQPAVGVWASLHEPALTVATWVLPGPQTAHGPLPMVSYIAFGSLAFLEAGFLGGLLGWIRNLSRPQNAL